MSEDKKTGNARKGFASESPEDRDKRLAKSLATRRRNKLEKEERAAEAKELRIEADESIKYAESLRIKADKLDGNDSSDKARKAYEFEISESITATFGNSVSPPFLKQMIAHAILRKTRIENIVTPTFAAMDILNNPQSNTTEIQWAIKTLQQFESAKAPIIEDDTGEVIGSVQGEMDKLNDIYDTISPKETWSANDD